MSITNDPQPHGHHGHGPTSSDGQGLRHADVSFDHHEIKLRYVYGTAIALVIFAGLSYAVLYGMYDYYNHRAAERNRQDAEKNPTAVLENEEKFYDRMHQVPGPRLEGLREVENDKPFTMPGRRIYKTSPPLHPSDLDAANQPLLQEYGPAEPRARSGYARIPIDQAMRLLLERKDLKIQPAKNAAQHLSPWLDQPNQANAGRGAEKKADNKE